MTNELLRAPEDTVRPRTASAPTASHDRVLDLIASAAPLEEILEALALAVQEADPSVMTSVLLLDRETNTLHPATGPSIPAEYLAAVDGVVIGPGIGTCGSAAWSGEPTFSQAVSIDPRWAPIREFVMSFGIQRSWSWPILGSDGAVLGTFACYGRVPGLPDERQRAAGHAAARLASIAIEHRRIVNRLTEDARVDNLTGLPNRRALFQHLDEALARCGEETRVGVLFLDLDRLKHLNDTLGHDHADALIREFARRVTAELGPGAFAARLGGDEFVVVVRDVGDAESIDALAERLIATVARPLAGAHAGVALSTSIGIALVDGEVDAREAVRRADSAMYEAKRTGGGRCARFDGPARRRTGLRASMGQALEGAELRGETRLEYEPLVDLATRETVGLRAILRWRSPVFGEVATADLVALAHETGAVVGLGAWSLREACDDAAAIARAGGRSLPVHVEVSVRQLARPGFSHTLAQVLAHADLAPHALTLELDASAFADHDPQVNQTREEIRALGVKVTLTGAELGRIALAELAHAAVDGLAVGPQLASRAGDQPLATALVSGLAGIATALGCPLAAVGVSTAERCETLGALGCTWASGLELGRPRPATEFAEMLPAPV